MNNIGHNVKPEEPSGEWNINWMELLFGKYVKQKLIFGVTTMAIVMPIILLTVHPRTVEEQERLDQAEHQRQAEENYQQAMDKEYYRRLAEAIIDPYTRESLQRWCQEHIKEVRDGVRIYQTEPSATDESKQVPPEVEIQSLLRMIHRPEDFLPPPPDLSPAARQQYDEATSRAAREELRERYHMTEEQAQQFLRPPEPAQPEPTQPWTAERVAKSGIFKD